MNPRLKPRVLRQARRGLSVLEMVLVLPIIAVMTIAVIKYGTFFLNAQQLEMACRVGALAAARHPGLPATTDGDPVPTDVVALIERQLETSGIQFCSIRLEHNAGGSPVVLRTTPPGGCDDCGPTSILPAPPPGKYVRLTVCVELRELLPQCLRLLNLQDPDKAVGCTTVYPYQL